LPTRERDDDDVDGEEELTLEPDRGVPGPWPARHVARERQAGTNRYLLDLDSDLADELDLRLRLVARPAATALTAELEPGVVELARWLAEAAPGPGVLILEGVLAGHVRVGDRTVAELVGAGDLIQPVGRSEDEIVGCEVNWRALVPCRVAVLDGAFAERVQPWPQISRALLRRSGRRTRALNVQRAITAQPRLEVRLALLLWHLGSRWGKVEPGGIRLPIPLTHQLLGRLVSAERPSVSHALARLANAGLVTGHGDEWHLHGSLPERLASIVERDRSSVEQLVGEVLSLRF
jgi:CRP/FNR family transcriptional regulator, cyclic AMP receptor protein